jgi:hypothetical protein
MRLRTAFAIFALACLALIAIFLLALLRQGEPIYITLINVVFGISGAGFIALVLMGVFLPGGERWKVFVLVAILLLLFSVLTMFSIGIFVAPVALALLGIALWKLLRPRDKNIAG